MRDYETLKEKGVKFFGEPKQMPWGTEVVFADLMETGLTFCN